MQNSLLKLIVPFAEWWCWTGKAKHGGMCTKPWGMEEALLGFSQGSLLLGWLSKLTTRTFVHVQNKSILDGCNNKHSSQIFVLRFIKHYVPHLVIFTRNCQVIINWVILNYPSQGAYIGADPGTSLNCSTLKKTQQNRKSTLKNSRFAPKIKLLILRSALLKRKIWAYIVCWSIKDSDQLWILTNDGNGLN